MYVDFSELKSCDNGVTMVTTDTSNCLNIVLP